MKIILIVAIIIAIIFIGSVTLAAFLLGLSFDNIKEGYKCSIKRLFKKLFK